MRQSLVLAGCLIVPGILGGCGGGLPGRRIGPDEYRERKEMIEERSIVH